MNKAADMNEQARSDERTAHQHETLATIVESKDRKLAEHTRSIAKAYRSRAEYIRSRCDGK